MCVEEETGPCVAWLVHLTVLSDIPPDVQQAGSTSEAQDLFSFCPGTPSCPTGPQAQLCPGHPLRVHG